MLKAVLFDVDGVLMDSFEANLKFFQDLMTQTGYQPPTREEFPTFFHLSMLDAIQAMTKTESDEEVKRIWEIGKNTKVGYLSKLITSPKGLEKVIETLSDKYLLGIVTSRIQESVFELPQLAKLKNRFKVVVAFPDTTHHKPHPEPLLLAAQKLHVKPEECIYIGDVENDVIAAHAAGMMVIIYSTHSVDQADLSTSSFVKIPDLVLELDK